jgi:hypothetical protein
MINFHSIKSRIYSLFFKPDNTMDQERLDCLKELILEYYSNAETKITKEISNALLFLKYNPISYFPCALSKVYNAESVVVEFDNDKSMYYGMLNGNKMYFPKGWDKNKCIKYFYCIQEEQDRDSPHCYLSDDFSVASDDIVVDIGAAEGIFTLQNIDKAKKIYLFETSPEWIEALQTTFAPWKDKVKIVCKFVSNINDNKNTSLDHFFKNKEKCTFLKIDVDGAEQLVLNGCSNLLLNSCKLKLALCTYHNQHDAVIFSQFLSKYSFSATFSSGVMLFLNDIHQKPPYFRKGILRAVKK